MLDTHSIAPCISAVPGTLIYPREWKGGREGRNRGEGGIEETTMTTDTIIISATALVGMQGILYT